MSEPLLRQLLLSSLRSDAANEALVCLLTASTLKLSCLLITYTCMNTHAEVRHIQEMDIQWTISAAAKNRKAAYSHDTNAVHQDASPSGPSAVALWAACLKDL